LPCLDRFAVGTVEPINERSTHARMRDPSSRVAGKTFRSIHPLRAFRSRSSTDLHRLIQNVLSYLTPELKPRTFFQHLRHESTRALPNLILSGGLSPEVRRRRGQLKPIEDGDIL
jgi:hypothetical protein